MAKETKCPECGTLISGYEDGDICSDCHYIGVGADEVLHHIDTMYPAMWKGVAKTARTSIRNTIKSQMRQLLS